MKHKIKDILANVPTRFHAFKDWEPAPAIASKFNPAIKAIDTTDETTLNILSNIGVYFDWWDGTSTGTSAADVSAFLERADGRDVTININSPGGDYFEGLAIYNFLDQYKGNVHVRILGLAASAASFVAMAGDRIDIAKAGFFMIHNSLTCVCGNKNDMRTVADMLAKLDEVMAGIYVDRTGMPKEEILAMLDAETWISGEESVAQGFADGYLGEKEIVEQPDDSGQTRALKRIDRALAQAGVSRSERRKLIGAALEDEPVENLATPRAGLDTPTPRAGFDENAFTTSLEKLKESIKPTTNP